LAGDIPIYSQRLDTIPSTKNTNFFPHEIPHLGFRAGGIIYDFGDFQAMFDDHLGYIPRNIATHHHFYGYTLWLCQNSY